MRLFERFDIQIGIWVITSMFYAFLATFVCDMISTDAQGSGVPEAKTILSGINFFRYLQPKTLIAKFLGLVFAQAAGFHVGIEGPIIHCSMIIAHNITRFSFFKQFRNVGLYDEV